MRNDDENDFLTDPEEGFKSVDENYDDDGRILQSDEEFEWHCQYCGELNVVWLDLTISGKQDFVEDCSVCCRPNRIILTCNYDNNYFLDVRQLDE